MSKEKQIEEMAKVLCGMKNSCEGCMWDKVHCNERTYAEEIYNAGYRKQSEGEWIEVDDGVLIGDGKHIECSKCGVWKKDRQRSNFCSSCGAKMKGGAE